MFYKGLLVWWFWNWETTSFVKKTTKLKRKKGKQKTTKYAKYCDDTHRDVGKQKKLKEFKTSKWSWLIWMVSCFWTAPLPKLWCVLHVFPKSKCAQAPKKNLIQTHYENRTPVRLKHANGQNFKNRQTRVVPARHLWIVPHVLLRLGGPSGCKSLFQMLEHGFHFFLVDYATLRLALAIRFHLLADKCEW